MKVLDFPVLRQAYNYDCGAIALEAVLVYYGVEIQEGSLIKTAHTTPIRGTSIKGIINTVKKYGLRYKKKIMDIDEIKKYVNKKVPVIIALQAWKDEKKVKWEEDWKDGHYVVAIGYDKKKIIFEDPSSFERTFLSYDEIDERWHCIDVKGKKYYHLGIAVYGKKPKYSSKKILHMG